jgi:uncharacterized protein YvpB
MRIRNYFFLALALVIIGVIGFSSNNSSPIKVVKPEPVVVTPDLNKEKGIEVKVSTSSIVIKPAPKVFKLDVPYFSQQYKNSCEAASLRMALAYYNIKISDDLEIVKRFGYKPRQKDIILNEWDNPQEMFVGNIDIVGSTEGYGVYGRPVAKTAISYGRDAYYETNITAQFLAKEIKAEHPIILWGYTSITNPPYTWNLKDGGEVKAFKGEHARLVIGFEGDVENPTGFYVHDPFNGNRSEYWSAGKLIKHIYTVPGVTNQAVVIK